MLLAGVWMVFEQPTPVRMADLRLVRGGGQAELGMRVGLWRHPSTSWAVMAPAGCTAGAG